MRTRADLIEHIIKKRGYKRYLEIGVDDGFTFRRIGGIPGIEAVGVDPNEKSAATIHTTSDDFFEHLDPSERFDMVFVDGMHLCEFVYRDIQNSLKFLSEGGVIACHDMLPLAESWQERDHDFTKMVPWNGDCWKAFSYYLKRSPYHCYTLDMDCGIGIIDTSRERVKSEQSTTCRKKMENLAYSDFAENRDSWMNVKDPSYAETSF